MRHHHHAAPLREGFALPLALLAMLVIGAIVTAGFYASAQENRVSMSSDLGAQAFYAAEYGINETLGAFKNGTLTAVAYFDSLPPEPVPTQGAGASATYTITIRNLRRSLYLITSIGQVRVGGKVAATRRLGLLARTSMAALPRKAALTVFAGLTMSGNSLINGNGAAGCAEDSASGITTNDSSLVHVGGSSELYGSPALTEDLTVDTTSLQQFGSMTLADLQDASTLRFPNGIDYKKLLKPEDVITTDTLGQGTCNTTSAQFWGDPTDGTVCSSYYPIIYSQGDAQLSDGEGQGILIVDGNLKLTGNMEFHGVVIVTGSLEITGTGNHVVGGAVVLNGGAMVADSTTLAGNSVVQYSKCAVDSAFNKTLPPRPLSSRSWIDLSGAARAWISEQR